MSSSLTTGNPLELKKGQLYLIFDPRLRGVGHNCELAVSPFKRHPLNPVLTSELPWERGGWWMSPCCGIRKTNISRCGTSGAVLPTGNDTSAMPKAWTVFTGKNRRWVFTM